MTRSHVLQIGMDPNVIDFTPWPGQSADALHVRLRTAQDELREAGFDVATCLLTDDADVAETAVRRALTGESFDVVEIGSGLRASHDYTLIFERVINVVTACQPGVPLCFNDSPETTLAAVRRSARPADPMKINRIVPDLTVNDLRRAVKEHAEVLGLDVLMDHGWIVTLGDGSGHQLSLMTTDASAPVNPDVSVFVGDIEEAYEVAVRTDLEIVHPLTNEPWGVRRFFYRDSSGRVINVGTHI